MHRELGAVLAQLGRYSDRELSDLGLAVAVAVPASHLRRRAQALTTAVAARAHLLIMAMPAYLPAPMGSV